jgi:hypothetical protein
MALDLADLDPEWKKRLWSIVKDDRALRTTSSVELQLKHLFMAPAEGLKTIGPILFVIDALDESGDRHSRTSLLQAILKHVSALSPNFRILITSRPEEDIERELGSNALVFRKRMEDLRSTDQDIRRYIEQELSCFPELDSNWPNGVWFNKLVGLSEGFFQWAATACRFVKGVTWRVSIPSSK